MSVVPKKNEVRLKNELIQKIESLAGPGKKDVADPEEDQNYFDGEEQAGKEHKVGQQKNKTVTDTVASIAYEKSLAELQNNPSHCHFTLFHLKRARRSSSA
jgi:hypothetical protein